MPVKNQRSETRSPEQLRRHYEIEKELANRLRRAGREQRRHLYRELYDELLRRIPDHPKLLRKNDPRTRSAAVSAKIGLLAHFVRGGSTCLEVGAGDCSMAFEIARTAVKVYAVDVSEEITRITNRPDNVEIIISDGISIPVPAGSVDVAYSNHLMEHLHPDDATEQLRNISRALSPGGVYICLTPNRLSGPHDISKYFEAVASGFHLREYTNRELSEILAGAGFSKVRVIIGGRGRFLLLPLPVHPFAWLERTLEALPRPLQHSVSRWPPVALLLGIKLVAWKQASRSGSYSPPA